MFGSLLTVALAVAAAAPPPAGDRPQRAERLFREGRALLKADLPHQACPKFRQSLEVEPALGTLLNLADCEERTFALVQAWLHFNDAAAWADRNREAPRAEIARDRASALKNRLSWLALSAEKPAAGLTVKVNDLSVELGATPQSVPVNPGEALVVASADGAETFMAKVKVGPQQTVAFKLPPLVEKAVAGAPPPTPAPADDAEPLPPPSDAPVERQADLTPAPLVTAEQQLVAQPFQLKFHARPGPVALMAGGGLVLAAGAAGVGLSLDVHQRAMRQQPGGPDAGNPTVSRQQFEQLQWAYPLSWVAVGVGAAALLGGAAWSVLPTGNGVSIQGAL